MFPGLPTTLGSMSRKQYFLVLFTFRKHGYETMFPGSPPSRNMARKQCFLVCPPLENMTEKQCIPGFQHFDKHTVVIRQLPLISLLLFSLLVETSLGIRTPVSLLRSLLDTVQFTGNAETFQKKNAVVARILSVGFLVVM